jgi:hypothetical protein
MDQFVQNWCIPKSLQLVLEKYAYQEILAPPGIAPRTKYPLSVPSDMTAHHWVNFVKVYGKYLLSLAFTGIHMVLLCDLIELAQACLVSEITPDWMIEVKSRVKNVARHFQKYFPSSEWSMVMHLLAFHIPATMSRWGPVRQYWCFPFERSVTINIMREPLQWLC